MKFFRVNSRVLLLFAGLVWITAGANVLRVGIEAWRSGGPSWPFGAAAAAAVFLLFYLFVFKRLYFRHANRIESKEGRSCPFSFFDIKGWIVMGAMIAFGAAARSFGLFSDSFVSLPLYRLVFRPDRDRNPILVSLEKISPPLTRSMRKISRGLVFDRYLFCMVRTYAR